MLEKTIHLGVAIKVQGENGQVHYVKSPIGQTFQKIAKQIESLILIPGDEMPECLRSAIESSPNPKDDLHIFALVNPKTKSRSAASSRS